MKPLPDEAWDDDVFVVTREQKNVAVGRRSKLLIAYDGEHKAETQRRTCPAFLMDGTLCRMPRHHEGLHVPFSSEVVAATGVYVVARMEL